MASYGITENGFVRKPLSAIVERLNSRFTGAFGTTFDTTPESPDGQVIGIVANEIALCWDEAQKAYNAYKPSSTEGIGLDNICELTRAKRFVDKRTEATVFISGNSGTRIPADSVINLGGYEFATAEDVTIPSDVLVTCKTSGAIVVPTGAAAKMVTQIPGVATVVMSGEATTGVVYETDPELRARRDKTVVSSGTATAEAIYAGLAGLNLDYVRIRDNDTSAAIGTQPANSIYVVVDGGQIHEIAKIIYKNKTGAVPTHGNISVTVADSKGYPHTIKFSRTSKVNVWVSVSMKRLPEANLSTAAVEYAVKDAVVSYINTLPPGTPVVWSYMVSPILAATPGIQIDEIKVGLSATSLAMTTLNMDIDKRAWVVEGNISVIDNTNK